MPRLPRCLTVAEVQWELDLQLAQVMNLIESGQLPAFRLLGEWRVERSLLDAMVHRAYERPTSEGRELEHVGATRLGSNMPRSPAMSPRQRAVCQLAADGLSNAEIAAALVIEVSTVKTHISRALHRLDLTSREQLIAHLWRSGFMSDVQDADLVG